MRVVTAPGAGAGSGGGGIGGIGGGGTAQPGQVLGITQYAPASPVTESVTGATVAAFDATNLTVTFTAPASGKVKVRLEAVGKVSVNTSQGYWGLLLHGTSTLIGELSLVMTSSTAIRGGYEQEITGLAAGTTYQLDWAGANGTGGTDQVEIIAGLSPNPPGTTAQGPAIMTVTQL